MQASPPGPGSRLTSRSFSLHISQYASAPKIWTRPFGFAAPRSLVCLPRRPPTFYFCSRQQSRTISERQKFSQAKKEAAPIGAAAKERIPANQCAVSVEESSSTGGSVVTEVSVGLAF